MGLTPPCPWQYQALKAAGGKLGVGGVGSCEVGAQDWGPQGSKGMEEEEVGQGRSAEQSDSRDWRSGPSHALAS